MISFVVAGTPVPQGSMRLGRGRVFHDSRTLGPWREAIAWSARAAGEVQVLDGPVRVDLAFTLKPPQKRVREHPCVRPDVDKLARAVLDALEGVCYANDSQVVDLHARKRYGVDEGVTVALTLVEPRQPA